MGYEELRVLAESYRPREREALFELAQTYRSRDEREILQLAAIAADISLDSVLNLGLEPEEDPLFRAAFVSQYPNVDIHSLVGASDERLNGLANGVKESISRCSCATASTPGSGWANYSCCPVRPSASPNRPRSPVGMRSSRTRMGPQTNFLQFKATESMGYVKEALVKHPDIRVVVPSEVDDIPAEVMGTDVSNEQLDSIAQAQIGEIGETVVEDLLDKGAEAAFDSIPFATMIATGVIEGGRVLTGRSTLRESFRRGALRMGRAGVYNAIGVVLAPTGVAVPLVIGVRTVESRVTGRVALGDHLEARTLELCLLNASVA